MNKKHLIALGVPDDIVDVALQTLNAITQRDRLRGKEIKKRIKKFLSAPEDYITDEDFGKLARVMLSKEEEQELPAEPVPYQTWGKDIDEAAHLQMEHACLIPHAVGGALMPDAHFGYGLPIGGVLAMENAIIPYAVGVDIACRMKLSILDLPPDTLKTQAETYREALEQGTVFGMGRSHRKPQYHEVLDKDWSITRVTRINKDKAYEQLGSSGSGNHFVEFGVLNFAVRNEELDLEAGTYAALLSHSGSRGAGAAVCNTYAGIAQQRLPARYKELGRLAWLELDSEAGQEYWKAMNLMGEYAAANHDIIHRNVIKIAGGKVIASVENHHNFAWKEWHNGKELIVHRKGATPAGEGVMGIIPGSMATPGYLVKGKGNKPSFHSASHGAGRSMSRKEARDTYRINQVKKQLATQGITVLNAGSDEVPYAYKNIHEVMEAQSDLVDVLGEFLPKIVMMAGDKEDTRTGRKSRSKG